MISSLENQTFKNFEVIIVNDGSTDDTYEFLNKISFRNLKVIHSDHNGPANARNIAIENSRASIILNLDADDKIAPEYLEKAYNKFLSEPELGIVSCNSVFFGSKSGLFDTGIYSIENMLFKNRIISQSLFRKEDWKAIGGYSGDLIYGMEDWDLWLSIIELGRKVYKIPEDLVYYRTYADQEMCRSGRRDKDRIKMISSLVTIFKRHIDLYRKYPKAFDHFSRLENKLKHENPLVRNFKNKFHKMRYTLH
jgi:glycosyltransferase involved in cell wall biosynthesis